MVYSSLSSNTIQKKMHASQVEADKTNYYYYLIFLSDEVTEIGSQYIAGSSKIGVSCRRVMGECHMQ